MNKDLVKIIIVSLLFLVYYKLKKLNTGKKNPTIQINIVLKIGKILPNKARGWFVCINLIQNLFNPLCKLISQEFLIG